MTDTNANMQANKGVTQVYWKTLEHLLNPTGDKVQDLLGFDDEFVDIVDYIIRITHRIWEQKDIGRCYDYYADYCPVHTLGGYCDSVEVVVQNTLKTIAAFPDRSLIGENVIWSYDEDETYYSSHRITSIMTNKNASEFGPATGNTGRVMTIADCVCKDNRIVYEWLMRDNSFLVKQLGISPFDAAKFQAQQPISEEFASWIASEYKRVRARKAMLTASPKGVEEDHFGFVSKWVDTIFNQKNFNQLAQLYHLTAKVQWPGGRRTTGLPGIAGILTQWLAQCPDSRATLDHIAVVPFGSERIDIAIRWSLAGTFSSRDAQYSQFSGQALFLLAATHLRIHQGKIEQEWTVFDEVSMLSNLILNQPSL